MASYIPQKQQNCLNRHLASLILDEALQRHFDPPTEPVLPQTALEQYAPEAGVEVDVNGDTSASTATRPEQLTQAASSPPSSPLSIKTDSTESELSDLSARLATDWDWSPCVKTMKSYREDQGLSPLSNEELATFDLRERLKEHLWLLIVKHLQKSPAFKNFRSGSLLHNMPVGEPGMVYGSGIWLRFVIPLSQFLLVQGERKGLSISLS